MTATTPRAAPGAERTRDARRRVLGILTSTSAPGVVELLLVAAGLVLLTAAVYGSHAIEGGFLSDDWAIQSEVPDDGSFFDAVDGLTDQRNMTNRPLMLGYMALTHSVFGAHMGFHLALAAGLAALMAWSVYLVVRLLEIERFHAGAIAVLVLVFPAADAPRLWAAAAAGQLTVAFFLLGLALALIAFRTPGRRGLVLHGASVTLYLASILLHESTLLAIGAAVLVYIPVTGLRRAVTRWLTDVACTSLAVLLVTLSSSAWPRQSFDGQVDHARTIFDEGWTLLGSVVLPLGDAPRLLILIPLVLLPLAGVLVATRVRRAEPARRRLLLWSAVVAGGFVVVAAGYLIYVPAISYYTPAATGIANRMNTLASVGFVLIAYGSLILLASLAFRSFRRNAALVVAVGAAGATVLGVGYLDRIADDSRRFERAYSIGAEVLGAMQQAVPEPPRGATIYSAGQPIEVEPGFPVFGNTWDLTGAARVRWNDDTLTALPYFPGTTMGCRPDGVQPVNPRYGGSEGGSADYRAAYGKVVLFHFPSRRAEVLRSREQCEAAASWFQAGPEYAPPET
jgi:hypothetical protein